VTSFSHGRAHSAMPWRYAPRHDEGRRASARAARLLAVGPCRVGLFRCLALRERCHDVSGRRRSSRRTADVRCRRPGRRAMAETSRGPTRTRDRQRHRDLRRHQDGGTYIPAGHVRCRLGRGALGGLHGDTCRGRQQQSRRYSRPLAAWLGWEEVAERFLAENPVTGLCAFDRSRIESATLAAVRGTHRLSMSD